MPSSKLKAEVFFGRSPWVASTQAVPMVGCPANWSSRAGVKIRTRAAQSPRVGGRMKVVSERFISLAMACISPSDQAGGFEDDREGIAPEHAVGEDVDLDEAVLALGHAARYEYIEKSTAFSVMNSRSAGLPSCVCLIARLMAGMISPGSVTRSPWPPKALAMSA